MTTYTPPTAPPQRDNWRRMPVLSDVILAACLVVIAILVGLVAELDDGGNRQPGVWWEWILIALPATAVVFRSTARQAGTVLAVGAQMAIWITDLASALFATLVLIYSLRADGGPRDKVLAVVASGALTALSVVGIFAAEDVHIDVSALTMLSCVVAYILGANAAEMRHRATVLASDLAVARVEQENERERVAADERSRIARELHDIVGHSLSVIAVRAEAADRVAAKDPTAAKDAVGDIAGSARSSLAEVRRVLVGMRSSDPELAPVPSLAGIPDLLTSTSMAGVSTTVSATLPPDEAVGPTVGAGAYRIVQEALTNVVKHGGPDATAELTVELDDDNLRVRVDDDGRGPLAQRTEDHVGSGLTGMRERTEVLGGTLRAGPRPGGGFRVEATLPVTAGGPGS